MRASRFLSLTAGISVLALTTVDAACAEMVKSFRDWTLYTHQDKDGKLCYIASLPSKQEGSYKNRDQPAVFVSRLPTTPPKEEVSVQPGYNYKTGSDVEVVVDGTNTFSFFSQADHAWARTPREDRNVITAMRRGKTMTVKGTSARDTFSLDTYSLVGFTAAYAAMQDACKDARSTQTRR